MSTPFHCERCSKPLQVAASFAGRVITCPYCRQTTTLTLQAPEPEPEEATFTLALGPTEPGSTAPEATQTIAPMPSSAMHEATATLTGEYLDVGQDDSEFELGPHAYEEDASDFELNADLDASDEEEEEQEPPHALFPNDLDVDWSGPFSRPSQLLLDMMRETRDAMRAHVPDFIPNPFAIYFPLEKTVTEEDRAEEEEFENRNNDYDVDDLIEGIDKPDGGF